MDYNNTTATNGSTNGSYHKFDWDFNIYYFTTSVNIIAGALSNLWLLAAILTSVETRSKFRNKVMALVLLNLFIKAFVCNIVELHILHGSLEFEYEFECGMRTFANLIRPMINIAADYSLALFFVQFIFSLLDYDFNKYFSAKYITAGTILVLLVPWILSIIGGPSILYYHYARRDKDFDKYTKGCLYVNHNTVKSLAIFTPLIPTVLDVILLIAAVFLSRRRWSGSGKVLRDRSMATELIGRGPDVDHELPYVIVCAMWVLLVVPRVISNHIKYFGPFQTFMAFIQIVWCLAEFRVALVPVLMLAFPDIRQRVKTWRPWYRPGPGIDIQVKYPPADE